MQALQDIECYVSGLNYYYDEIVTTEGVCDTVEFELLSEFKMKLDEFSGEQTWQRFDRLNAAYEKFYVNGFLHKKIMRYDLQEKFDCISELMMRLKRICGRTS